MAECNFHKDKEFSEKFNSCWDKWYQSEEFYNKLQLLRKKGKVKILKIDRCDNPIFQKMSYLDTIITLSTGSALLIDEKVTNWIPRFKGQWPVELFSNPTKYGKSDGWGYHVGTTMVQAKVDKETNSFIGETPIIYTITQDFVDNVTRQIKKDGKYFLHINASTGGLYNSGFGAIPRNILESYWYNGKTKQKQKILNEFGVDKNE